MPNAEERYSRAAFISFASNYNSAAEAIMELVDNPIDYRGHDPLHIEVDVDFNAENPGMPNGRISIRDWGGQGMNLSDLRNWLYWGAGENHDETQIGQFHVGGKLAAIYLAEKLQVTCRRQDEDQIWYFADEHWGSRTQFAARDLDFEPLHPRAQGWISELEPSTGFVQVTLSGIKHGHFTLDELRSTLTDTYETLLESGELVIRVNGEQLSAYTLPWLSGYTFYELDNLEVADGVILNGRIGALNRRDLAAGMAGRVLPGIRTDFNGRKITSGERFGINLHGRGRSQRVFGEISITGSGFRPNQNKTGWDVNSAEWAAISRRVKPLIQQVVRDLEDQPNIGATSTNTRKKNALVFQMRWLNDDGAESHEAERIERAAAAMHMLPKEWVRYIVRRALASEDAEEQAFGSNAWYEDDIVQ